MTSIKIRPTDDLELIQEQNKLLFPDAPLSDEELATSDWWTAESAGDVVGFAGIQLMPYDNKAFLIRAGVAPEARGAGLQKRLIRVRTQYAKRNGIPRCFTYVWAYNHASMRSLIACGYRPYYTTRTDDVTYTYFQNRPAAP